MNVVLNAFKIACEQKKTEADVRRCSSEQVFLKFLQTSQENTCV